MYSSYSSQVHRFDDLSDDFSTLQARIAELKNTEFGLEKDRGFQLAKNVKAEKKSNGLVENGVGKEEGKGTGKTGRLAKLRGAVKSRNVKNRLYEARHCDLLQADETVTFGAFLSTYRKHS